MLRQLADKTICAALYFQMFQFDHALPTLSWSIFFSLICRINSWQEMHSNFWVLRGNSLSDVLRMQLPASWEKGLVPECKSEGAAAHVKTGETFSFK